MYAGKGDTVELPTEGHLHILKTGYVYYENDGKWDKAAKRMKDGRVSIGKLDPNDRTRMYPNRTYFDLFAPSRQPGQFGKTLSYGPYYVLQAAAEKVGCLAVLKQLFPKLWEQIFALDLHAICARNSIGQDFEAWAFTNYSGLSRTLDSKGVSRVYEAIAAEPDLITSFMKEFRKEYETRMPGISPTCLAYDTNPPTTCVALDSTNQNTTASKATLAEFGHAKKKKGTPQINTALFVDESTGIPLFYEHFLGSILDKTQTPYTMEKAKALGFEHLFVMMDRGYFSAQAVQAFADLQFGLMCPDNTDIVNTMIDKYAGTIVNNEQYYLIDEDVYGIHVTDYEIFGGKYDAYLFYDPARADKEREQIHDKIRFMIHAAEKRKRFTDKLKRQYSPWLTIEKSPRDPRTGRSFTIRRNNDRIQEEISRAGLFVVVSNANLEAWVMIHIARMRDWGEKSFQRMKAHLGLETVGTHTTKTYEGKMFVTFVALIVIEAYRWFIRNALHETSSENVTRTLGELSKYQIVSKGDGTWMPVFAATRKQKLILAEMGLSADKLEQSARQVKLQV